VLVNGVKTEIKLRRKWFYRGYSKFIVTASYSIAECNASSSSSSSSSNNRVQFLQFLWLGCY
jgi:hypothetical protein